jgi:hypothetical protein
LGHDIVIIITIPEVSIPNIVCGEGQFDEEDKTTFSPLDAMAAILVQHGELIVTSYTAKAIVSHRFGYCGLEFEFCNRKRCPRQCCSKGELAHSQNLFFGICCHHELKTQLKQRNPRWMQAGTLITSGNIESPLLARQGLETRKFLRSED